MHFRSRPVTNAVRDRRIAVEFFKGISVDTLAITHRLTRQRLGAILLKESKKVWPEFFRKRAYTVSVTMLAEHSALFLEKMK